MSCTELIKTLFVDRTCLWLGGKQAHGDGVWYIADRKKWRGHECVWLPEKERARQVPLYTELDKILAGKKSLESDG